MMTPVKKTQDLVDGQRIDRWALNFGVSSAFALILVVGVLCLFSYQTVRSVRASDTMAEQSLKQTQTLERICGLMEAAKMEDARHYGEVIRAHQDAAAREEKIQACIEATRQEITKGTKANGGSG